MRDFLTTSQFDNILMFKVVLGIFIVYLMYRFAVRNPTDFDTLYRRRMRYVYGAICAAGAIGFIFLACTGPFKFSLPWYYLSTYGTISPSADALQHDVYSNMIVRPVGAHCILGKMTFEQWSLSSYISGVLEWTALAVYAFTMKRSSVKWFAKLRKAIGYVLLIIFPGQINGLHYFDYYEIIPLAIYIFIVYILVRTYKFDHKAPVKPIESQHENIPEFAPEHPQQVIENIDNTSQVSNDIKKKVGRKINSLFIRKCTLWFGILLLLFLNVLFTYRGVECLRISSDNPSFHKYHVWVKDKYYQGEQEWIEKPCSVDYSLGRPINGAYALSRSKWDYSVNEEFIAWYANYEIITYDITDLGYSESNIDDYYRNVIAKHGGRYVKDDLYNTYDYCVAFGGNDPLVTPIYGVTTNMSTKRFVDRSVIHYVYCKGKYAYEIRNYFLKDVRSEELIKNIYFKNPFIIDYVIYSTLAILVIISIIFAVFFFKKPQKDATNLSARKLLNYITISSLVQVLIVCFIVIMTCINHEYDDEYITTILLSLGTLLNLLLAKYVSKMESQQYAFNYLLPKWFKEKYVAIFKNNILCTKASLVLLFYPLFYIVTFPFGFFAFPYIILMALIFAIVYLIRWIFNEYTPQVIEQKVIKEKDEIDGNACAEKLRVLKGMLEDGLITQADYDKKKSDILKNFK